MFAKRILPALAVLLMTGTLVAQNWSAEPLFGARRLNSGFAPDPVTINVLAGGDTDATTLGLVDHSSGPCRGFINAAQPDVRLHYTAGSYSLRFYVVSAIDTTLLVNLPDTTWRCNDDASVTGYSGPNPLIHLANPPSGQYDIWIGSYAPGSPQAGALYITELDTNHPGNH